MFTPGIFLQECLNTHPRNMYRITGALIGYINADPAFKTNDFEEAVRYVLMQGISEAELYREFDSAFDLEEDESKWDNEYYAYARVYLKKNFCRKRIEHVKKVAKKIYSASATDLPDLSEQVSNQKEDKLENRQIMQAGEKGGQSESGKKSQGQMNQGKITRVPAFVKIAVLIVLIGVVLALLIAFIIKWEEHPMEKELGAAYCRMTEIGNEVPGLMK